MIYLVGAGPGDPGLLTVRAEELIESADIIFFDALVADEILDIAKPGCRKIMVGKRQIEGSPYSINPPCRTVTKNVQGAQNQKSINQLLIQTHSDEPDQKIVRLKGGDPFIFGRGGEEACALVDTGIPFEVVPGVSSAIAAPAYAGIPVTSRGLASEVTFITGQNTWDESHPGVDYARLAKNPGTLVFLMGVSRINNICEGLLTGGMSKSTPASVIQWGTCQNQMVVKSTLSDLVSDARKHEVGSPSIIVIGKVAALSEKLDWLQKRPLIGKRILVTRPKRKEKNTLESQIRNLGGFVVNLPTIDIQTLHGTEFKNKIAQIDNYTDILFTSRTAVRLFSKELHSMGLDVRNLSKVQISVVCPGTKKELQKQLSINADIMPDNFSSEGLIAALGDISKRKFLFPCAVNSRDLLTNTLGDQIDALHLYEPNHSYSPRYRLL
ncbi:MAG: uroporphyrinogen-III C-methyltransferase [Candidatus Lindowbacteria bacterium]|nr:uroporphyrinogen-III C-methyltransferase [Candidatus Lindowbacteria bacterium]